MNIKQPKMIFVGAAGILACIFGKKGPGSLFPRWDAHHDVVACMRRSQPFAADACPLVVGTEALATRGPASLTR